LLGVDMRDGVERRFDRVCEEYRLIDEGLVTLDELEERDLVERVEREEYRLREDE
jgi:hypothetical protein